MVIGSKHSSSLHLKFTSFRSEREQESTHEGDLKGVKEYDKMIESAGRLARRKGLILLCVMVTVD